MSTPHPIYLAGDWVETATPLDVVSPFDGSVVGRTFLAGPDHLEQAIVAAEAVRPTLASQPVYERAAILHALAAKMRERRDDIARTICLESGKPIRDSEVETDRGIFTVVQAAEDTSRIHGEVMPLDLLPSSKGRFGMVRRFPIGIVAGISPFNFPLNLALHKICPAIAAGCPIVLKPPTKTPLTMLLIMDLLDTCGLPKGAVSVLPMDRLTGDRLVEDERFAMLSFTGSPDVGWDMKRRSGKKKVVLELGGNAGVLIDEDSDLAYAANRVRIGAFAFAGQVCISVQRVLVHDAVYDRFVEALLKEVASIKLGDPLARDTDVGPMIDDKAAVRTQAWIAQAVAGGARVLAGGTAEGRMLAPTVIENAPPAANVCAKEAFAPLLTLFRVPSFRAGVRGINDSAFGLQAGVFTNNFERALYAYERIEAGGVVINDIPTYRIDHMPYGGIKDSGLGREGLRYAIEEMTEPRLMVVNRLASQAVKD